MARKALSLKKRNLWTEHTALYQSVFFHSLKKLKQRTSLPQKEDEISAVLFGILKTVCKSWSLKKKAEIPAPLAQLPKQDPDKAIKTSLNSLPKPDFICPKFDPEKGENLFFDVECKLLGDPTSKNWILNKNYVTDGVFRFDCQNHEYGKDVSSGMMIGYIISMAPDSILKEVNANLVPSKIVLYFNSLVTVDCCCTDLNRKHVVPSDFKLSHLWVDLRSCLS